MNKLTDLAEYLYLFGNDCRLLHLYAKGDNFLSIHALLEELYDLCFDFYDTFAEMAIAHDERVINPSLIQIDDWESVSGKDFTTSDIAYELQTKGNKILSLAEEISGYERFVESKIDEFNAELDKIVNYKISRVI